ncbi:MAG: pilus assembly protein [Anaerolineae bacterium]|nr:pilus assembly protein [Anaerolineae bacterium]
MRKTDNLREERGSALVETAFASVFLTLLVVAVFEFGMVFSSYVAVISASRAGASYASMHPSPADPDYNRYADVARNELRAAFLDMREVSILPPETPEGMAPGQQVRVTVTYRLRTFTSGISLPIMGRLGLPDSYTVSWTTAMPIR